MAKTPDTEKTVLEDTGTMMFTDFFEDAVNEVIIRDKKIKELQKHIIEFINELAWEDVKYDAMQSTMGEFTGSPSAVPRYAKKYFDLWKEMFGEELRDAN